MNLFCIFIVTALAVIAQARNDGNYHHKTTNTKFHYQKRDALQQQQQQQQQQHQRFYRNTFDRAAQILQDDRVINPDGSYQYQYQTSNGISGREQGTGGVAAEGASSYTSPEGVPIKLSYTADVNGYHPVGDHVAKIPDYILRSHEYIRAHPYKVITWEEYIKQRKEKARSSR